MKTTLVIFFAALILAIVGVGAYLLLPKTDDSLPNSDSMDKTETMMKTEQPASDETSMEKKGDLMENTEDKMMQSEGKYVPFSPEVLAESATSRRVLFFYANWCPTCKPADTSFTNNTGKLPKDVTVIRVNYNDTETDQAEKELAKKYGVTYQHTFVQIDANGNEVSKWNGGLIDELLSNVK